MDQDVLKTLAEERTKLETKLADEREAHGEHALAAATGSKDAQRGVEEAETEIKRLLNLIERNDNAKRVALAKQTAAGIAQAKANTRAAGERAVRAAVARIDAAKRLDALFAEAGQLLKDYGQASRAIREDLRAVIASAELTARQRTDMLDRLDFISTGPASAALSHAIASNGIGREGVRHFLLEDVPMSDKAFKFADVAELAADAVASRVAELVGE